MQIQTDIEQARAPTAAQHPAYAIDQSRWDEELARADVSKQYVLPFYSDPYHPLHTPQTHFG